ncbi:hypothetical protein HOC29_02185 [archaeon]|jgi:hypothetical protein|nr:hypothetical protein [archaeon]MBT4531803.1 hypothetical protein [archaeon]
MAKQQGGSKVLSILAWLTGIVVSLVVGNAMIVGPLQLPAWLGGASSFGVGLTMVIGWIVVITTLISAVLAIIRK